MQSGEQKVVLKYLPGNRMRGGPKTWKNSVIKDMCEKRVRIEEAQN